MRFEAMKCMSRSYRPTVPVGYVAHILGFLRTDGEGCTADVDDGLEECEKWLKAHGTVLSEDNNSGELQIDMKVLILLPPSNYLEDDGRMKLKPQLDGSV